MLCSSVSLGFGTKREFYVKSVPRRPDLAVSGPGLAGSATARVVRGFPIVAPLHCGLCDSVKKAVCLTS